MTKEQALTKIKELEEYIKELDKKELGFENDEIFLLSAEEYEKYKRAIPKVNTWWWLRSPSCYCSSLAAFVHGDGSVSYYGNFVLSNGSAVRPAIKLNEFELSYERNFQVGKRFIKYDFPWIYLGDGIAIAEVPIMFDMFDDKSNNYENSYIRNKLHDWLGERR